MQVLVSVSGGRTSGYMAWWMKHHQAEVADHLGVDNVSLHFVFANTGMEHNDTLRFLDDMDHEFDLGLVWVEGVVNHGQRKGSGHRVVNFHSAYRNNQWLDPKHPYHNFIIKYGIPNVAFPACTREMKSGAIESWCRENIGEHYTAIGIRADEKRRVSAKAGVQNIIYPLVDLNPVDVDDVTDWWSEIGWDLTIPIWQGNCVMCFKKTFKKLKKVYDETPEAFDFTREMERRYSLIGPEFHKYDDARPRTFFRKNTSTEALLAQFDALGDVEASDYIDPRSEGCTESCEMYETEAAS